jgi:hypothetical protein
MITIFYFIILLLIPLIPVIEVIKLLLNYNPKLKITLPTGDVIKTYSIYERYSYLVSTKYKFKTKLMGITVPYLPSDRDIFMDYIVRDLIIKRK